MSMNNTMVLYKLFQSGLIFTALVAGLACLGHVIYCRTRRCRNWSLIVTTLVTGFFHLLWSRFMLSLSEESTNNEILHGDKQHCYDYSMPATISNSVICIAISVSIIRNQSTSKPKTCALSFSAVASILTGLYFLIRKSHEDPATLEQKVFMSFGGNNTASHVELFWSVCMKEISEEKFDIIYEYCLIYLPVTATFVWAWGISNAKNNDCSPFKVAIINGDCEDDSALRSSCVCSTFNSTFIVVLFYAVVILFIIRPVMILYGYLTTGQFRDILPSLLNTVVYCFICSEYLMRLFKMNIYHKKNSHVISKEAILV